MSVVLLGVAALLVAANAFFVAAEFAIVKVRVTKLEELERQGIRGSRVARIVTRDLDAYLSATQLGITLASLGLGWIGEPSVAHLLRGPLSLLGLGETALHSVSLAVAFLVITIAHIVLGELAPKSLAILRPEKTTLAVAVPLRVFYYLFFPFIWVLNSFARALLRRLGLSVHAGPEDVSYSERELRILLARSSALTRERARVVQRALALPSRTARQLLLPRTQVMHLSADQTLEEARTVANRTGFSRFPVTAPGGGLDSAVGIAHARDVLNALVDGGDVRVGDVARTAIYVPDSATSLQILQALQEERGQMALVVDEHGGVAGILTVSDVVHELLGPLPEDSSGRSSTVPPESAQIIEGTTPLRELAERIGVEVDSASVTVAGYVIERLQRFPRTGDRTKLGGSRLVVERIEGPRIVSIRIVPALPPRG